MAILQISRITQRKGLQEDLPQPLAGAEFGWSVDQRRLFIGNGDLADGAPVVGNTEILTEFSDVLSLAATYTYKGEAAGYQVQTGPTVSQAVSQSLQTRLDNYAIVTEFGATGDGVTDDTQAINRALFQLYCRQTNTQVRRSLFFPAGTYLITDTILVPPFAQLYGEGSNSSIIQFRVNPWVSFTAYTQGILVYYSANDRYYRSINPVPIEDPLNPGSAILPTDATYWAEENLPEYVMRTSDNLQQTGTDILTNGATFRPQYVEVRGLALHTDNYGNDSARNHNILLVEDAEHVIFDTVTFAGPFTVSDGDTSLDELYGITFDSTVALVTKQCEFNNCVFTGLTDAINTDEQIQGVTISNSRFDTLTRGVVLGSLSPVNGGPTGVRIVNNMFDNVYREGVVIEGVSLNASAYNTFFNVGNSFNASAGFPCIDIDANNNISVGDMFERTTSESVTHPRIKLNDTTSIALGMNIQGIAYTVNGVSDDTVANRLSLGTYSRTTGVLSTLNDNDSGTLYVVDTASIKAFRMDYTITRDGETLLRIGTLQVVSGAVGTFSVTDTYTENDPTGVTLSATEASPGGDITVAYSTTSTGAAGTINYSITYLA